MTEKRYKFSEPNGAYLIDDDKVYAHWINDDDKIIDLLNDLVDENEELKQRNNRQAKQLDRLYNLIEEKDWRTLTDIIDDFKRCEEQLQKEWGTYGDVE
jgi:hypothetical protein